MALAVRVLLVLCFAFLLSQFQRASLGVIAPDLMAEIGLTPEGYGLIASGVFIGAIIGQIPVGIMLDRFGPRKTTSVMQLIAVVATLIFAIADDLGVLLLSRIAAGVGFSASLMGSMVVAARWFPPDRFALITGVILSGAGGVGSVLAGTPMALLCEWLGWRGTFLLIAGITLLSSLSIHLFVIDAPEGHPYHRRQIETLRESIIGLGRVFHLPQIGYVLMLAMVGFSTFMTVMGVWGGLYLHDVHGLDTVARGNVLTALAIGNLVGFLAFGPLDRIFDTRKGVILLGSSANIAVLATLALVPELSFWQVTVLFFLLGVCGAYHVANLALGRALLPDDLVGRGMTLINLFTFIGLALMQIFAGLIVGAFATTDGRAPVFAYRLMFGFMAVVSLLVIVLYSRVRDIRPSSQRAGHPSPKSEPPGTDRPATRS